MNRTALVLAAMLTLPLSAPAHALRADDCNELHERLVTAQDQLSRTDTFHNEFHDQHGWGDHDNWQGSTPEINEDHETILETMAFFTNEWRRAHEAMMAGGC
jgi:hypothetical protein